MDPSRIHHVGVQVADVDQAVEFLQRVFGLEIEVEVDLPDTQFRGSLLRWGDVLFEVFQAGGREEQLNGAVARIDHVAVATGNLEEMVEVLREHGVHTETSDPVVLSGGRMIFVDSDSSHGVRYQLVDEVSPPAS